MHNPPPFLELSLRATLAMAVALLLAWGTAVRAAETPASPEQDVAALKAAGGTVTETAGAITKLQFKDCSKLGEADFARIGRLKSLKSLTLYGKCAGLTDTTLPLLSGLTSLEEFSTEGIQVSDEGLNNLAAFTNLKSAAFFHISLGMKSFTGVGFAHLKGLAQFERLTVAGTPFNDEGMAAVSQITNLKEFRTWHTFQTPAGTAALQKLPNLRSLRFGQRLRQYDGKPHPLTIDDEAIGTLAKISSLETLFLDEARLSLAGLEKLKALPKLKELTLEKIIIAPADIEKLKATLPTVKITYKPVEPSELEKLEKALKP